MPGRIDWVDYAKGICIVMVVMMHSVLGVEAAAGQTGFMHILVAFAKPFRMPDFFLISGLFLSVVIDRDWRTYLDRKVVHFAYFYVLWVTIQFGFKAPSFAAEAGWAHVGFLYLESFIEPFGTLWFIYLLPVFFVVTKAARKLPPALIWGVAALLEMAHISTGWTVIDEFCARFVYFYSGYLFAGLVFAWSGRRKRARVGALASRFRWSTAAWSNGLPAAAGLAGAGACGRSRHRHRGHAAGARALAEFPALLRRAFDRHLSGVLPADGGDADAAAEDRLDPRYRDHLADRYRGRHRRRAGDLADRASCRRHLPVRAPGHVLDRAEKGGVRAAGGGVGPARRPCRGPTTPPYVVISSVGPTLLKLIRLWFRVPAPASRVTTI
jgi:hypothetical protein